VTVPRVVGAAVVLAVLVAGCGGSSSGGGSAAPSAAATSPPAAATSPSAAATSPSAAATSPTTAPLVVHIRNFHYLPANPQVRVGQPITIVNDDRVAHTWSAAPGSGWQYTSGNLEHGQQVTFPGFTKVGRYKFLCFYHAEFASMNGVATVR
jgi:plastocyanin